MADSRTKSAAVAPKLNGLASSSSSSSSIAAAPISTAAPPPSAMRGPSPPYGTRSRNRGARVNYAEHENDNDMDLDVEDTPPSAPPSVVPTPAISNKASNPAAAAAAEAPSIANSTRRASAAGAAAAGREAKESHPYTAAAPPTAGRKRKSTQMVQAVQPRDLALSNMLHFDRSGLKDGKLVAHDGTAFSVHDHIYLVCEPPGEPYYLARIMEFLHANNDPRQSVDSVKVNWYYRPRDVQRKVTDTRMIFATMHSDVCPLNSIRGKCHIRHRSEVGDMDEYRKLKNHFWFEKMFDRYIHRYYDVIPTTAVRNVPEAVRKVLVERWKYLLVEPQRGKELCSQMKECKRCAGYCVSNESVHCAVCNATYHMGCVRPPLTKKPSRGFAWACGPCSRAQDRRLAARNTPNGIIIEDDVPDEEEEDLSPGNGMPGTNTPSEAALDLDKRPEPTPEQLKIAQQWQMRYLGQHCRIEDALDLDDRIYPRAASRIGPRHQANVLQWPGRPVEYVKTTESKKKTGKGGYKGKQVASNGDDAKEKEKRPKWVMDEPAGYIKRGEDDGSSSTLLFKLPISGPDVDATKEAILDEFMHEAEAVAKSLPGGGIHPYATNFKDKCSQLLYDNNWNTSKAMEQLQKVHVVKDLKEPRFKPDEIKRFEEGVAKFGSEIHQVAKHVKTRKTAETVRFYYGWKKTQKGREIWGNYENRRHKKELKQLDKEGGSSGHRVKLADDVADAEDDSAFDHGKAATKKRGFLCKYCGTKHSRMWRRAPGVPPGTLVVPDKGASKKKGADGSSMISALCHRCAEIWRRYGVQYEDPEELKKKLQAGGGRQWKRRIDEELLKEFSATSDLESEHSSSFMANNIGTPLLNGSSTPDVEPVEPPRKKAKTESNGPGRKGKAKEQAKEKEKSKEPPPPPPEPPKPRMETCAVCTETEEFGKQHLVCRECHLVVHRRCYGTVGEGRNSIKWTCETCVNDKNPTVSTTYDCVLCPIRSDNTSILEEDTSKDPPNKSHRKKSAEKRSAEPQEDGRKIKEADRYRPAQPRQALKKTANNNWAHILCAVWTPEIKFTDPIALSRVEGIAQISPERWKQSCVACQSVDGSCISCHQCNKNVHVGCAKIAGWALGFDMQPVKASRRDAYTVKLGDETGHMTAAMWCPEHVPKAGVHRIGEVTEQEGQELSAMELYCRTYKQADLTLTGTARKANLLPAAPPSNKPSHSSHAHRRPSIIGNSSGTAGEPSIQNGEHLADGLGDGHVGGEGPKRCAKCNVDVALVWRKYVIPAAEERALPATNGVRIQDVLVNGDSTPKSPSPIMNGDVPKKPTIGLICHKCFVKEKEGETQDSFLDFSPELYKPLPPLHLFLNQKGPARPQQSSSGPNSAGSVTPVPAPSQPTPPIASNTLAHLTAQGIPVPSAPLQVGLMAQLPTTPAPQAQHLQKQQIPSQRPGPQPPQHAMQTLPANHGQGRGFAPTQHTPASPPSSRAPQLPLAHQMSPTRAPAAHPSLPPPPHQPPQGSPLNQLRHHQSAPPQAPQNPSGPPQLPMQQSLPPPHSSASPPIPHMQISPHVAHQSPPYPAHHLSPVQHQPVQSHLQQGPPPPVHHQHQQNPVSVQQVPPYQHQHHVQQAPPPPPPQPQVQPSVPQHTHIQQPPLMQSFPPPRQVNGSMPPAHTPHYSHPSPPLVQHSQSLSPMASHHRTSPQLAQSTVKETVYAQPQSQPPQQLPPPLPPREEPRRILSGASGSPALANLLS